MENKTKKVYKQLQLIDWTPIDYKVKKELNTEDISEVKDEALKFYAMCLTGKGNYSPSEKVDVYWHQMILNTAFYRNLSVKFGKFVDHSPRVSDQKEELSKMKQSFNQTINDYKECFGTPNSKVWGLNKTNDCSDSDSGNCSGAGCERGQAKIDCQSDDTSSDGGCTSCDSRANE